MKIHKFDICYTPCGRDEFPHYWLRKITPDETRDIFTPTSYSRGSGYMFHNTFFKVGEDYETL